MTDLRIRDPRPKGSQHGTVRRSHQGPRILPKLAALLAFILAMVAASFMLTGCGGSCAGHGGVLNDNKGTITCADGTVV